ncbi:hypothetical protein [Myxococcus llanfairpwllgwyngyllgogerychwyrndrobwllllantysiliogogogochensis]|uniref:hypothetical protein n=1 Tax=Myxococcus llanfairpwllgwyngyllgogerychwyrndrobwllllantysiliogogogochensis TaxID=2590453 RepID=UPI0015F0621C|nr:hypothetical protein [Myxococcus llanfairpwllgwyngyllgogerychwyrndrobwllllantysiliogogogochensis]
MRSFKTAFQRIPEPWLDQEATTWVRTAIGDMYFQLGDFARARTALLDAVRAPEGLLPQGAAASTPGRLTPKGGLSRDARWCAITGPG